MCRRDGSQRGGGDVLDRCNGNGNGNGNSSNNSSDGRHRRSRSKVKEKKQIVVWITERWYIDRHRTHPDRKRKRKRKRYRREAIWVRKSRCLPD